MMTRAAFAAVCRDVPYIDKGIFYSEMFLFLKVCDEARVNLIIESGVKFGVSTALLSRAFTGAIVSIDRNTHEVPPGVMFVQGEAAAEVPRLIAEAAGRRIGVLLDGPKGEAAIALKDVVWADPSVCVVAIHDRPSGIGEQRHSHDAGFRSRYGRALDALIISSYAEKYPNGPGLAVWVRA